MSRRAPRAWFFTVTTLLALVVACEEPRPARRAETSAGGEDERRREVSEGESAGARLPQTESPPGDADVQHEDTLEASDVATEAGRPVEEQLYTQPVQAAPPSIAEPTSVTSSGSSGSSSSSAYTPPNLVAAPPHEPSPIALLGFAIAPSVPTRVLLGLVELPPGQRFEPPVSSCQDVLLYVVSGTLDASGYGIASVDTPATLYAGDAVRFGPEGDGLVVNTSGEPVRTVVAIARSEDGGPARLVVEERGDRALCPQTSSSDALSRPQRVGSASTSLALSAGEGALEVRILLDADAAGAEHAGLAVLSGTPSFAVSEHTHDASAEVLYFEDGAGTMRIGDRTVDVGPGVTVYVPEGTPHSFEPTGTRPLRAIQFYAPSGPEQRFRGTGA
jgi:mannose-6-phosphate isomerase-like protein (cupin superfamily)